MVKTINGRWSKEYLLNLYGSGKYERMVRDSLSAAGLNNEDVAQKVRQMFPLGWPTYELTGEDRVHEKAATYLHQVISRMQQTLSGEWV